MGFRRAGSPEDAVAKALGKARYPIGCAWLLILGVVACDATTMIEKPWLRLEQLPENPPPGISPPHGVIAGIWPDGAILRAQDPQHLGSSNAITGYLSRHALLSLQKKIDKAWLKRLSHACVVTPDARVLVLTMLIGNESIRIPCDADGTLTELSNEIWALEILPSP